MSTEPVTDTELRLAPPDIFKTAVISECGKYRYSLVREWDADKPRMCWVMLNPSTADASIDDPTIRRCVSFAKRQWCGSIEVVNLFAYRSKDPKVLRDTEEFIGTGNDNYISEAFARARIVVAAWGASKVSEHRGLDVLLNSTRNLYYLGQTKQGGPRHPLYVSSSQSILRYWTIAY